MKRIFLSLILTAATLPCATVAMAQKFEDNFEDKTLRLDEKFLNGNGQSYF